MRSVRWVLALGVMTTLVAAPVASFAGPPLAAPFDGARQYARSRPVDFNHLRLECSFDLERESVKGSVTHHFTALRDQVETITLDAVDIAFEVVKDSKQRDLVHRVLEGRIEIDLAEPMPAGASGYIYLVYSATPKKGLYFIRPIPEYPDRPLQIWTQGEPHEARHWIPCFDAPEERITSEMIATVPYPLEVLSNGLFKQVLPRENAQRTYHWVCENPHSSYLITLVAGEFERLEDTWQGVPIHSWHYPGDQLRASLSFGLTADMMDFFSQRFGRYPFDIYNQVVVRDFLWGGMENITATTLTDRTLHDDADEPQASSVELVAHELAHQWFGNLVTCRDWSHIWLNESFATFCATLYTESALGRADAQMEWLAQAEDYFAEDATRYRRPLVCATYQDPDNVFDSHSYPKGARVLGMLRHELGDETFFRAVRSYLQRFRHQTVVTDQLRVTLEDVTGAALARFFDDWVYKGGHPEIEVRQQYDSATRSLELKVRQRQKVDDLTPHYSLPVSIGIYDEQGHVQVKEVRVDSAEQTFTFDVAARPAFVRFDHQSVLLMKLDHEKTVPEWSAQLTNDPDALGRVFAARALGARLQAVGDAAAESALTRALAAESFWGVRREVATALGNAHSDAAAAALERALAADVDPRVRDAAARALGRTHVPRVADALASAFRSDASAWVRAASLEAHEQVAPDRTVELALEGLGMSSHRERVRTTAIRILEKHDHVAAIAPLMELARPGAPRPARDAALRALAKLGAGREEVLAVLGAQVSDPHRPTRAVVFEALGTFGGEDAQRVLESRRPYETREDMRDAIDRALAAIAKPGTLDELATEVGKLKAKSQSLEEKVQSLEGQKR